MVKIAIGVVVGAVVGAAMGATRSCETGGCPLTANPYRGAIYGAVMGFLLASSFAQSH